MIRILIVLVIAVLVAILYLWYSSQSLPDWYEQDKSNTTTSLQQVSQQINRQGVDKFLRSKIVDALDGTVTLNETEFNALLIAGLNNSKNGRRLLSVSKAINAEIHAGEIELGAVVNLDKASAINDKTKKVVAGLRKAMPLLDDSTIFLAVRGTPIAKSGNIGFADEFGVKIGAVPISSNSLQQLGVPVERVSTVSLPMKYMTIKSIELTEGEVRLKVFPKF